jgi:hypothetical protein
MTSPRVFEATHWAAGLGAVTAEALAIRTQVSVASAGGVLRAGARAGVLARSRPLHGRPALFAVTARGLRAAGVDGLAPGPVSASNAGHLIAVALVAATLERRHRDHRVEGERELRRDEQRAGRPLASARLGMAGDGGPALHRADLVLWPHHGGAPVAVEVELTVKAPRRLVAICRAWARCGLVDGVLYYAPSSVAGALRRAIAAAQAGDRVVVLPLESFVPSGP